MKTWLEHVWPSIIITILGTATTITLLATGTATRNVAGMISYTAGVIATALAIWGMTADYRLETSYDIVLRDISALHTIESAHYRHLAAKRMYEVVCEFWRQAKMGDAPDWCELTDNQRETLKAESNSELPDVFIAEAYMAISEYTDGRSGQ